MFDRHIIPSASWGLHPVLFTIFGFQVQSYSFFLLVALVVGGLVYWRESRTQHSENEHTFYIALAALFGGVIGAKIPSWLMNYQLIVSSLPSYSFLLSGRTIVGGLIGGTLSVYAVKKYLGISGRRGNLFAPAVALGMAIGRIGCLLRGCCYGVETHSDLGIDFGDGIHRHPTQLYEIFFWLIMFVVIQKYKTKVLNQGVLFTMMLTAYFIFRFFLEYIKNDPDRWLGLSIYQLMIIFFLGFIYRKKISSLVSHKALPVLD